MDEFPDFSAYGYRVERELGHNRAGGRVTYLAAAAGTDDWVVIKQFQFAKSGSSWADFSAYDREIQVLKELDHPGIPRYLNSFQTADGFCMVQEYKPAESLGVTRSFNPDEIRQIAIAALEVLVYLQNRIPPIIHRDLKPENILVDDASNVYLVDFGFARVGEGEVGVSSVVKGTLGFMPPEQLFNRHLTEASDLYGLGMTLICLLTGTHSDRIGDLVDISYRVSFKHLVPKLNQQWVHWLEKMVEPRLKDRYPNAVAALAAVPASPVRPPEAHFSQSTLEFQANRLGEVLVQTVTIANPIPDTTLEGDWQVAPHPHDPKPDLYQWIYVEPSSWSGNQTECRIYIDTRKLMAGKAYCRTLRLHTNTLAGVYSLALQIQTAPVSIAVHAVPIKTLLVLIALSLGAGWLTSWIVQVIGTAAGAAATAGFGALVGVALGLEAAAWLMRSSGWRQGGTASSLGAVIVGAALLIRVLVGKLPTAGSVILATATIGAVSGAAIGLAIGLVAEKLLTARLPKGIAIVLALLTATVGASAGLSLLAASSVWLLLVSGVAQSALLLHLHLQQLQRVFAHRRAEQHLIRP